MPTVGTLEILVILLAIILFGPKRIPEIARKIGSAITEFRKASDGLMMELTQGERPERPKKIEPPASIKGQQPPKAPARKKVKRLTSRQIREAAKKLGISIEGRTDEELRSEIMERMYSDQPDPYGLTDEKAG